MTLDSVINKSNIESSVRHSACEHHIYPNLGIYYMFKNESMASPQNLVLGLVQYSGDARRITCELKNVAWLRQHGVPNYGVTNINLGSG